VRLALDSIWKLLKYNLVLLVNLLLRYDENSNGESSVLIIRADNCCNRWKDQDFEDKMSSLTTTSPSFTERIECYFKASILSCS